VRELGRESLDKARFIDRSTPDVAVEIAIRAL
jgi:hypothetical protein